MRIRRGAAAPEPPGPRAPRGRRLRVVGVVLVSSLALAACLPHAPAPPRRPPPVPTGPGTTIMGPSGLTAAQIAAYVCHVGRCATWLPEAPPQVMAQVFLDEGTMAGVRGDIAFCQAILETGWFAYPGSPPQSSVPAPPAGQSTWPGYMLPRDHNYAGIGAYPGSRVYMRMPTVQLGVRAQIQHLRNFADPGSNHANLGQPFLPRPGYDAVTFDRFALKGSAPRWVDLNGRWAVPGTTYAQTILSFYNNMRAYNGLGPVAADAASVGVDPASVVTTQQLQATTTFRN